MWEMWDKLNTRYEADSTDNKFNKFKLLTSLIRTRYQLGKDLVDSIAELDTYINKLSIMCLPVAEGIQVQILLESVMNEDFWRAQSMR